MEMGLSVADYYLLLIKSDYLTYSLPTHRLRPRHFKITFLKRIGF